MVTYFLVNSISICKGIVLSEVKSTTNHYIEYARELNNGNLSKFALAVCIVCLLILTDTSGPSPLVKYNHIFNSDNISIVFFITFLCIWIIFKIFQESIKIQRVTVWAAIIFAYLFSDALSYLGLSSSGGITAMAVAHLMIAFLFVERLKYQLLLIIANGVFFFFATNIGEIAPNVFVIALLSVMFMSAIVSYTMDIQRQNVFYAQQKIANQVEELNRALDVKSVFFGHMSHELRTPLSEIIGFSDMLKTMDDKMLTREKVHEYAEYINSGGNHLLSLVNDILDQNKLEAGGIAVSIERVDVCELLQNYVDELNPISMDKQQQVNLHFDDEALLFDTGQRLFKQIIYNLLSNAQKYTPEKASLICPRSGLLKILKSAFKIMARGFLLKLFNKSIKPAFLLKRILFQKRKVRGLV
jgi:signal transduction histidine kinase